MKSGLGEFTMRAETKGSTARLKIVSKKAGMYLDSPIKKVEVMTNSTSNSNLKSFRINQSKQSSQLKLNDSRYPAGSRKGSQPSEVLEKQGSPMSPHGSPHGKEYFSSRRQSGFPNYLLGYSPRR